MKTKYKTIEYRQNNQRFLSLILPLRVIDAISEVLIYGENPDGYQRRPNKLHYNKIKKYATQNINSFILPTAIMLGCNSSFIDENSIKDANSQYLNLDSDQREFRIVDGQHRICGLREAAKDNPQILDFELPVIVILTNEDRRSVELEVFTDINSKAKRINTDLAELAKHDYQIKEKRIREDEIWQHIGIKTAFYLKDKNDNNVWQNAIKFDIHSEVTLGIIGVSIFTQSIKGIIDQYIIGNPFKGNHLTLDGVALITYCQNAANEIGKFLYDLWNDVIRVKWNGAFNEDIIKNDEGQLVKIFYSKDYYIQKGIGIKSINPIISTIVLEHGINQNSYSIIKEKIFNSKVKIEHWKNGGPFAGFNSESGFNKIMKMILNEISVPEDFVILKSFK